MDDVYHCSTGSAHIGPLCLRHIPSGTGAPYNFSDASDAATTSACIFSLNCSLRSQKSLQPSLSAGFHKRIKDTIKTPTHGLGWPRLSPFPDFPLKSSSTAAHSVPHRVAGHFLQHTLHCLRAPGRASGRHGAPFRRAVGLCRAARRPARHEQPRSEEQGQAQDRSQAFPHGAGTRKRPAKKPRPRKRVGFCVGVPARDGKTKRHSGLYEG